MITKREIKDILESTDRVFLEGLALKANRLTRQYFGRAISLYAPIYLSNYCDNNCVYCGFNSRMKIERKKLSESGMESEMQKVSGAGIQNVLLLTGGSRRQTPPANTARVGRDAPGQSSGRPGCGPSPYRHPHHHTHFLVPFESPPTAPPSRTLSAHQPSPACR